MKINKLIILMFGIILLSSSFISAQDNKILFGRNESNPSQMIPVLLTDAGVLKTDMNFSSADIWDTNLGELTDANATQFSGTGGVLSILESFIDSLWCRLTGCTMSGDIDMGANDISNINNLTVNNNLTVGDVLVINDRLVVGVNLNETNICLNPGDGCFGGNVISNATLISTPKQFGAGLAINSRAGSNPDSFNITFTPGSILNTDTGLFCDFATTQFSQDSVGKLFSIGFSDIFGFTQISFEVLALINSSCIDVSLGVFGAENVSNITVILYVVTIPPIFFVVDNGNILANIGPNPDSNFKINVLEATGPSSVEIKSTIADSNTNIFKVFTDVDGNLDTRNFESTMVSGKQVNGSVQNNFMITGDLTNNINGTYIGLELDLTNAGTNVTTTALTISSLFDSLITSGQLIDISRAYYDNTTTTEDVTSDFEDPAIFTTLFEENSSTVYIGNSFNFTKISFSVSIGGSQSILPEFLYCNSSSEWQVFSMADSTNGFSHSGTFEFTNPTNRGTCNDEIDGTPLANTTNLTYVAIRRTEISITIPPVISFVNIFRDSSKILIGNSDTINADTSFTFANEEFQAEGSIVHMVTSRDQNGQPLINSWQLVGKNNSYSGSGNSLGIIPAYLGIENFSTNSVINMTPLSNYPLLCSMFGVPCSFNADTRGNAKGLIPGGPLLWTMGDLEVWQSAKIHDGIAVEGPATFDLNGNHLDVNNGTLHISTPVDFTQGFTEGDSVTKFIEPFSGSLGRFTNLQVDIGNWDSVLDTTFCDMSECAMGDGAGTGTVSMQTNTSTADINETKLSFVYSLVNLIGSGNFSITMNNNNGSGDVGIFFDTTNNVVNSPEVISLPTSMDGQGLITITVTCDIAIFAQPGRQCFLDTVKLNGTATSTTLINVSGFDSVIAFSDGELAADGFPAIGLYYNASANTVFPRGNWNFSGGGGSTSPGGSNTQIQYNDGGVFGGAANLVWDDVNNRLGLGANSPGVQFQINSSFNASSFERIVDISDSDDISRYSLATNGLARWQVSDGSSETGQISYGSPGGALGFVFQRGSPSSFTNRFDFRLKTTGGGEMDMGFNADGADALRIRSGSTSLGQVGVFAEDAASLAFVVQGKPSQTADLQQWRDNTGTELASIDSIGDFFTTVQIHQLDDQKHLWGSADDKSIFANATGMFFSTEVGSTPFIFDNQITATSLEVNSGIFNLNSRFISTDNGAIIEIEDDDTTVRVIAEDGFMSLGGQNTFHKRNINIDVTSGDVGIGTTTPLTTLQVVGDSGAVGTTGIMRVDTGGGVDDMGFKYGAVAGAGDLGYSFIQSIHTGVANDGNLIFNPQQGNVGIGLIDPSERLDINGNLLVQGNINATGDITLNDTTISAWAAITDFLSLDGLRNMLANLNMGGNKIVNMTDPTDDQDASTKGYTDFNRARLTLVTFSSNTTLTVNSAMTILVNASDNLTGIILPDATISQNITFYIKKIDNNNSNSVVIITHNSSQKIDGIDDAILLLENNFVRVVTDGMNWFIIDKDIADGFGALEYIETVRITNDTTSFDFDAVLDGDIDGGYKIVGMTTNPVGSGGQNYLLRINGAAWTAQRQIIVAQGASISTLRDTTPRIAITTQGAVSQVYFEMPTSESGLGARWGFSKLTQQLDTSVSQLNNDFRIITPNQSVTITSLGMEEEDGSSLSIGNGSVYHLYKIHDSVT